MNPQFWQESWLKGKTGFHQTDVNKRLIEFWPRLNSPNLQNATPEGGSVFVPLCGKSTDMLWLHQQGYQVLGIELSEKAVAAFFEDNSLGCTIDHIEGYIRYKGTEAAAGITLLVGDYFDLKPAHIGRCTRCYDRASLIALKPSMRAAYTKQLARLMPIGSQGLLLAISYDESRMEGPPFSVPDDEVYHLMTENFDVQELAHYSGPERLGNLADRGLETLDERAYLLSRK